MAIGTRLEGHLSTRHHQFGVKLPLGSNASFVFVSCIGFFAKSLVFAASRTGFDAGRLLVIASLTSVIRTLRLWHHSVGFISPFVVITAAARRLSFISPRQYWVLLHIPFTCLYLLHWNGGVPSSLDSLVVIRPAPVPILQDLLKVLLVVGGVGLNTTFSSLGVRVEPVRQLCHGVIHGWAPRSMRSHQPLERFLRLNQSSRGFTLCSTSR
jgi:hypothetical protein